MLEATHVILVDSTGWELSDTKGVHGDLDLLARSVESRTRNFLPRDRILDQFVSITSSKMAKTIRESVDSFLALHGEDELESSKIGSRVK